MIEDENTFKSPRSASALQIITGFVKMAPIYPYDHRLLAFWVGRYVIVLDGLLFSVGNIFGVPASDSMSGVRKECVVGFYSVLLSDSLLHIVLVICS